MEKYSPTVVLMMILVTYPRVSSPWSQRLEGADPKDPNTRRCDTVYQKG